MSGIRSSADEGSAVERLDAGPRLIGERYQVQAALGEGGMARVYRVLDTRSAEVLALKQLVASGEHAPSMKAMFEREYHALVQLAHPHIVSVHDYGHDAGDPYYTMEMLEGADSRVMLARGALNVRQICVLVRDAASALALIHSRRMVHRDVSPRNLWCTPDGRAKLIDFGTLIAMGPQTRIACTAPFVPPEAVHAQALDARCDLYALGALAYFLLTKRNAYPAREVADLRQLWQRRPKRPDALDPKVPPALSDLVMAMLSLDVRGRPASAAEVFERLSAIADLPSEDESHHAQAFLTSPNLVGRGNVSSLLRKRLLRALRGRGGTTAIVAPAGLGRSRMLAAFVLEAKLMGAAAISVDASAVGSEPLAAAAAIAERLLDTLPMTAAMAVDIAPVLGHLSPALHRALGEPALAELATFERTRKLGSALVSFVQLCSQHQRLAIAIDDVHRADGASLGVFGKLSLLAGEHSFLLVISCESGMLSQPPPALAQLLQGRNLIELGALAPEDTHELLASLFGAAPGLDEAASWLHELSLGSPQTCMQYAQYLVEHDIARYEGGQWTLPPRLREAGLPATLGVMFEERVRALSDDARALALGLALARDESRSAWQPENHVHIEDFPKLIDGADSARTFSALDELVRAGMVQQRDSYYVLGQRAMVDALLRLTDTETARRTHRRLGELFEQGSYGGRLLGMRQLQRAGDGARACELVIAFIDRLANVQTDWGAMRLSVTAEVCMDALAQWRVQGGSVRDGIRLRRMLLMVCAVYDWTMAELGDEQIAQLRADGGLLHFDATDPDAPVLQRLIECLKRAQTEYDHKSEHERGLAPGDAIRELAACMMPLTGALVHSHDLTRTRAATAVIQPLRALSPVVELITQYCEQAVKRVSGQDIGDGLLAGAERLLEASELPDMLRRGGAAVNLHMQAVEDARRGRRRALVLMDRLVAAGTGDDMFLVLHGRWLGHAFRGEAALAQRFRKQTEVITEDDIWRRKSFVFVEAQLHALTGDLQSLTRVCDEIAELERRFVGWRPWLGFARGSLHRLRGELDQAESVLRAALTDAPAGEHRAWVMLAPAHAEVLLLRGDAASAVREADAALAAVQALGLDASAEVGALRVRALAESRQARHDAASASIGRALQCARQLRCDGLPLATLYEAQARIAIAAGVSEECVGALTRLRAILEHADAPALINAYEALREESTKELAVPGLPGVLPDTRTSQTESSTMFTEIRTRLSAFNERHERAQQALELLLESSGAQRGALFLFDAGGLFAAASIGSEVAEEELLAIAQERVDAELGAAHAEAVTVADLAISPTTATSVEEDARAVPILLADGDERNPMLLGVALVAAREARVRSPRRELVQAISRCLEDAGDSVPMPLDA